MVNRLNQHYVNGVEPPHVYKDAYPVDKVLVAAGTPVIEVFKANYRRATLTGFFIVKSHVHFVRIPGRTLRCVEVDCTWYTWRPPTKNSLRLILRNNEVITLTTDITECIYVIGVF